MINISCKKIGLYRKISQTSDFRQGGEGKERERRRGGSIKHLMLLRTQHLTFTQSAINLSLSSMSKHSYPFHTCRCMHAWIYECMNGWTDACTYILKWLSHPLSLVLLLLWDGCLGPGFLLPSLDCGWAGCWWCPAVGWRGGDT